ncbi:MAG: P-loop NTPase fold protein [Thermodesulfobacteriota bacterium]|nr:P-loop NTPase fold protein [Thermodesulfobacteriota bacterium]
MRNNVGDMVCDCRPPYVIGIHGNWGAGKTSFLRKIHLYLSGDRNEHEDAEGLCKELWTDNYKRPDNIETIWFDAWRYQFETNPVVPLLNEIRAHFTLSQQFAGKTAKLSYYGLGRPRKDDRIVGYEDVPFDQDCLKSSVKLQENGFSGFNDLFYILPFNKEQISNSNYGF